MKVYLLQHTYEYGEDLQHEEIKIIGIFESKELAEKTVEHYKNLPGFCKYSEECFYISEYELNKCWREEGFISWEEASIELEIE